MYVSKEKARILFSTSLVMLMVLALPYVALSVSRAAIIFMVTPETAQQLERKAKKQQEEQNRAIAAASANAGAAAAAAAAAASASLTPKVGGGAGARKKRRWDDGGTPAAGTIADGDETPAAGSGKAVSDWDADVATPIRQGFGGGETPGRTPVGGRGGETPGRSRWDQTPSRDAQVRS